MYNNKFKIAFIPILLSICLNNAYTQPTIKFKQLTVKDGLSESWVRSICQDQYGFMWFGTNAGLNKYDGYTITNYYRNLNDKNSLRGNLIEVLYEDTRGNLWIGTDHGINLYDRANDQFIHRTNWPEGNITDILELSDGKFFISSRGDGLLLFDPDVGIIKSYMPNENEPFCLISDNIEALLKDRRGNIWIGTHVGLVLFNPLNDKFITFRNDENNPHSLSDNVIESLLEDNNGRIWVGTVNNGLNLLNFDSDNPERSSFTSFTHNPETETSISPCAIMSLLEDRTGHLWIGTQNCGVDILDLNHFQENNVSFHHYYVNPFDNNSLSSNSIYSFFKDRDGSIWIGTNGNGLNYYYPNKENFVHTVQELKNPNSLNNNFVNVFYEDGNLLWIGTEGGLNLYNKKDGSYQHFLYDANDDQTLGSNAIWAIYRDSHNNLWFGTWNGGLNLFNERSGTFTRFIHNIHDSTSISSNNIFGILEDRIGNLWIGTMGGGLNKFDYNTRTFIHFNKSSRDDIQTLNPWINTLFEDSFGKIWISTASAIDVFEPNAGKFHHYMHNINDSKSLSDNAANIFFEDSKKNLWIGTSYGLNVYNRNNDNFDCYTKEHGLPNDQIKGILEDAHGNLWISTNKGLSQFVQGTTLPKNAIFKNYDYGDGIQGNEFESRSCLHGQDGTMYFGGNNGFVSFHPDSINEEIIIPTVILTNFLIYNKPVPIGAPNSPLSKHISILNEVTLNHKQSVFSIEYALLNYVSPEKNQYAFILDGFDKGWNYVGAQRLATYTNLDPGEYVFRVKGTINDHWEHTSTSLHITIVPPWWKTIWAYIFYFAFSGFVLFSIWWFQLNKRAMKHELMLEHQHAEKLEELDSLKSRFFANITHEFRSPLTLIMGPMKQFLSGEAKGNFTDIARMALRNSERLYQLINQILELSKLEAGRVTLNAKKTDIASFVENIVLSYAPLAEIRKIALQFAAAEELSTNNLQSELFIDPDKIQKVIANLLSNAFKFAPEDGHISVSIKRISNRNHNHESKKENSVTKPSYYFLYRLMHLQRNSNNNENLMEKQFSKKMNKHGFIEICVKDDGLGIRESDLNRIFDRFYQVADPRSGVYESTGIGLALAKELIELHSGTIHVESVYEHGASFFVRLPLGRDHLQPSEISLETPDENNSISVTSVELDNNILLKSAIEEKEESEQKNNSIILIVDDNSDIRKYISDHLKRDYQVLTAKDGLEGFSKAIKQIPDLIISDVMMPNMDGIELCSKIKQDELTSHIPVILLTVRASDEAKINGLETGADDYITKPFDIKELRARIRNLIEQRRQLKKKFNQQIGLKPSEITSKSADERFLAKALSFIEENMSDPRFGVEELAKEMALSRVQFYRKIRAITGQTAADFIRSVRLNRAAQLLKLKHDNISQIAYDVGFHSPSYFTSCFYNQFGVIPSEYGSK
ncbi:response regulator [candidate division KSB1 bacterium]|nr:response regulator [candidate division KSB1 bacterium]